MHAWDQPAERLVELASQANAQLLMPILGEPVEPDNAPAVKAWWREVEGISIEPAPDMETEAALPKSVPWPLD